MWYSLLGVHGTLAILFTMSCISSMYMTDVFAEADITNYAFN